MNFHRFRLFVRASEGSITISTALLLTVVMGAAAAAIDYSSAYSRKADLQRSADVAALAAARDIDATKLFIEELAVSNAQQRNFSNVEASLLREGDIATVTMNGDVPTFMLGIIGTNSLKVSVESKAQKVSGAPKRLEVALALDVTESMANDMDDMRTAARNLVEELYGLGSEQVKISVVPYTGAVNIGNSDAQYAFLDSSGLSQHHAVAIKNQSVAFCWTPAPTATAVVVPEPSEPSPAPEPQCTAICDCPGTPACGGGGDGASLDLNQPTWMARLLGMSEAHATSASIPFVDLNSCTYLKTPSQISHLDLFQAINGVDWAGCVEARPAPYDVTDIAPDTNNADTLFVPYFWPDDYDGFSNDGYPWVNEYVVDTIAPAFDTEREYNGDGSKIFFYNGPESKRSNVWKYEAATSASMSLMPPNVTGPNRGCPDPLQTLRDEKMATLAKIDSLEHRNGGGTVIAQGLMWAWRTLSPEEPFTGGAAYDDTETRKIVILMSDGANAIIKREAADGTIADTERRGDYSAYGYAADFDEMGTTRGFIDTTTGSAPYFDQIRNYMDERTRLVCDNIKSVSAENPVEIYSVLMGPKNTAAAQLLKNCATTQEHHYHRAIHASDLGTAFSNIAEGIAGASGSRIIN